MGPFGQKIRSTMTGTPAPYSMLNDNVIMTLFILNIVGVSYVFLMNGASILERIKCMFYYESKSTPFNDRTHITKICNLLLYSQTIFYAAIVTVGYLQSCGAIEKDSNNTLFLGAYALFTAITILARRAGYDIVNNIMFSKKDADEWRDLYFFTVKLAGFALTPAVIAFLFFPGIHYHYVKIYIILILTAYIYTVTNGLIRIIFKKRRNYLDIFLYLCALEFLPIALVWKLVLQLNEFITTKI